MSLSTSAARGFAASPPKTGGRAGPRLGRRAPAPALRSRRPHELWLPITAASTLALLAGLWFVADLLIDGAEEAREDLWEHVLLGLVWLAPAGLWLCLRPPRSRLRALLIVLAFLTAASTLNLLLLYRSLANDLGLPLDVSVTLGGPLALVLVLFQVLMGAVPAILLQALMLEGVSAKARTPRARLPVAELAGDW